LSLLPAPDHPAAPQPRENVSAPVRLQADEQAVLDGAGPAALAAFREGQASVANPKRELADAHRIYKETGRIPQTKWPFAWIEIKEGRRMTRSERYDAMAAKPGHENPTAADVGEGHIDPEYLTQDEFRDEFYLRAQAGKTGAASAASSRSAPDGCELPGSMDAGICVPTPARTANDRTAVWVTQGQIQQGKRNGAELAVTASMFIPVVGQVVMVSEIVMSAKEAITGERSFHFADLLVSNPEGRPGTPLTTDERAAAAVESIIGAAATVVPAVKVAGKIAGRLLEGEARLAARAATAEVRAGTSASRNLSQGDAAAARNTGARGTPGATPELAPANGATAASAPTLVGADRAVIDPRKLTEYALNPAHPVGGNKARVFQSALGFTQADADELMRQLREGVLNNPAVPGRVDQYGARFTVDIPVTGPNGNTAVVRSGWIYKTGSHVPEMTTVYVK